MKKIVTMLLLVMALIIPTSVLAATEQQPIKVFIEKEQLVFSENPFIENDVTLVQFRPIFEKLGLKIEWNQDTQTITGRKSDLIIKLTIGSTNAIVNDEVRQLVIVPKIVNGNTMVPLRFVSEASKKEVNWNGDTRTIQIGKQVDLITSSPTPTSEPIVNSEKSFRNVSWGMSMDDVKKAETEATYIGTIGNLIHYNKVNVANIEMNIVYEFSGNKLIAAGYMPSKNRITSNDSILDYESLKKGLITKYGDPKTDDMTWLDDLYKYDSSSKYGIAVQAGRLKYFATWDIGDEKGTKIYLMMYGKDFNIMQSVIYHSKYYEVEAQKNRDDSNAAGL